MSDIPPPPPSEPNGPTGGFTPPPPPPGGGFTPPPPPPPAYGGMGNMGNAAPWGPTEAIGYGWNKFIKKPGELIVPVLIVIAIVVVVEIVVRLLLSATLLGTHECTTEVLGTSVKTQCGPGMVVNIIGSAISGFFVSVLASALGAGVIKSALNVVDGKPVVVGDIFTYAQRPEVLTAAVLLAAGSFVATLLCYFPVIIWQFLTYFTMYFVVDKGLKPADAIKASFSFVTASLGNMILLAILCALVSVVGVILCCVGLLAAIPIVLLAGAFTFRRLHNEPVTAAV